MMLLQVVDLPPIDFSDGRWWMYVVAYLLLRWLERAGSRVINGRALK